MIFILEPSLPSSIVPPLRRMTAKSQIVVRGNKWYKEKSNFCGDVYHPFENATFSVTCSHQRRCRGEDLCSLHLGRALTPTVRYLVSLFL